MTWTTPDRLQTLYRAAACIEEAGGPDETVRRIRRAASVWVIDGNTTEVMDAFDEACAWLVGRAA